MELLKRLTEAASPSGRENNVKNIIVNEAQKLGYEISFDALGSVIVHRHGKGKKLMLAAHMDEIGIIAAYADEHGFIRFGGIGGLEVKNLPSQRVRFENGVIGVIGADEEFEKKPEISKLYIDIGANGKNHALSRISIGDTAVFVGDFYTDGDIIVSKAIDDRAGCYILLKAMENVSESENDLYFVFTAQEEVGTRGAKTAAYSIMPDYAIAVDVTDTGDIPSCEPSDVKLGSGAAIKALDRSVISDREVFSSLKELADKNSIPHSTEIMLDGGTDTGAIALTGGGVKAGAVSLPVRYIHSPSETAKKGDIDACVSLITAACIKKW